MAALAPKLRLASVLGLTWHDHIDPDLRFITVHHHKTATTTKRPQVVPISEQLRVILRDARQRTHTYVVEYRRRPVKAIRGGLKNAANRSGLPFGRATGGVTFHTLRHTAASLLAELGEPEAIRKEVMGHRNIATTQKYTHLRPMHETSAHERLADAVPIADLVMVPRRRAAGKGVGKSVGTLSESMFSCRRSPFVISKNPQGNLSTPISEGTRTRSMACTPVDRRCRRPCRRRPIQQVDVNEQQRLSRGARG